jgi:hypothetical protein
LKTPHFSAAAVTFAAQHGRVMETRKPELVMEHVQQGYRSLSLLMNLNWDRLLYGATIAFALVAGSYVGNLLN